MLKIMSNDLLQNSNFMYLDLGFYIFIEVTNG